jgi:hypothetical protein
LVYVTGWVLMIESGFRILPRILTSPAKIQGTRLESPQDGSFSDDKEILWKANELLPGIKLRRYHSVQSIDWADNQPWYWSHLSRKGFRGPTTLVLASSVRGRLGPDDWKTLLTYYFLQYKPVVRRFLGMIPRLVWPFVPVFFALGLASFIYGPRGALLLGQIVGPPVLFWDVPHFASAARKIFLEEDSRIAETVGVRKLLELFRKIDQLQLPDVENGKKRTGWIARLWPMPNITQRITNLEQRS